MADKSKKKPAAPAAVPQIDDEQEARIRHLDSLFPSGVFVIHISVGPVYEYPTVYYFGICRHTLDDSVNDFDRVSPVLPVLNDIVGIS